MEAIRRFNGSITKPGWLQKTFIAMLMLYGFLIAWNLLVWPWVIAGFVLAVAAPVFILVAIRMPHYALLRTRHMRLLAKRQKLVGDPEA